MTAHALDSGPLRTSHLDRSFHHVFVTDPPVRTRNPRTKPYGFIRFGAMAVTKPYELIGFGVTDVTKPYEIIWFCFWGDYCSCGGLLMSLTNLPLR